MRVCIKDTFRIGCRAPVLLVSLPKVLLTAGTGVLFSCVRLSESLRSGHWTTTAGGGYGVLPLGLHTHRVLRELRGGDDAAARMTVDVGRMRA